jgi:hypothetical protein
MTFKNEEKNWLFSMFTVGEISRNVPYTVRKMDLILRPIERRPQMQFSMARRFKLQLLRR